MRDVLEKTMMEIGEPFSEEEMANMMAIACDPRTKRINYEHYINLLIVCIIFLFFYRLTYYYATKMTIININTNNM